MKNAKTNLYIKISYQLQNFLGVGHCLMSNNIPIRNVWQ